MSDEPPSDSNRTTDYTDAGSRRQFLKLLTAGAFGGAIAVGLGQVIGDDDAADDSPDGDEVRLTEDHDSGPTAHDVFVYERDTGFEAVNSDGDTIQSGNDGWSLLKNSIDAVPDGGSIYVNGEYDSTSAIEISNSIRMYGHDASVAHQESGDFVFRFEGEERHRTTLTETAATGDNTVELGETSGMQKGDMILLEEVDGDTVLGRDQPPGEPHSVSEVDGNTVRLEDSIVWRDDYPSGTLVYVIDPIEVHMSGFSLEAPAKDENYYGVTAQQCRDSTFENLWIDKFGSYGISVEACANFRVRNCTILQSSDIEAADGYGIQVRAGCHDIIVEGCAVKECRHPLSVTPAGAREVASRTIMFRDCFVTADGSAALNCHGGAAHDVRFEGCMVHTWEEAGVRTGAQETNVSGCEFRMNGHHAISTRNDGQEMIITVTDTDIFGATNAVHLDEEDGYDFDPLWKLVQLDGVRAYECNRFFELDNGNIDRVRDLVIGNCYWDEVDGEGIRIRNQIDGGIIEGNNFGAAPNDSHIHSRDDPDTDVSNLHIVGNRFRQPMGTDTFIRLSHCRRCVVSENKFEAGSDVRIYADGTNSTANLIIHNSYYAPGASANPVDEDEGSIAENNYVYDTDAETWP